MFSRLHLALATLTMVAITGCATNTTGEHRSNLDHMTRTSGASGTILTAEQLRYDNGSILDAMSRHIVRMRVDKRYACPALSLRGPNTAPGLTEPVIYVDGAKTVDTCILDMMTVNDVERVEVYPSGISPHPGLFGNSHGLILVFTKHG